MAKLILLLALAAFQAVASSPVKSGQQIVFSVSNYDYDFTEDQPNLSLTTVHEVCNTGVWITYTGQNYAVGEGWGVISIYPDLETTCTAPFATTTGSTRLVGLHSDHTAPSVTLYADSSLQGEAVAFGGEISHLVFNALSLATINTNVQFFQLPNLEGESVCFEIDPFYCRDGVCWAWELYVDDLPWGTPAQSARAGCSDSAKVVRSKVNKSVSPTSIIMQH